MESGDIKLLIGSFLVVVLLGVFTFLAPVYLVPGDRSERHFRWNPPERKLDRHYDRMKPAEIESFKGDPYLQGILDAMKNQPTSLPYEHVYFGPVFGTGFNVLGYLTVLTFLLWLALLGYKIWLYVKEVLEDRKDQMPVRRRR